MLDNDFYNAPSVKQNQTNGSNAVLMSSEIEDLKIELAPPIGLRVKKSPLGGYGVFASSSFQIGEILEECPMVRTDYRGKDLVHNQIRQACFTLPCSCEECKHRGRFFVLVSGFGQIYNHSKDPDAKCQFDRKQRLMRITAIKEIIEGQEIFINYGEEYDHFGPVDL